MTLQEGDVVHLALCGGSLRNVSHSGLWLDAEDVCRVLSKGEA